MTDTPLDLDAIRARADAATPGPWAWEATGEKDNSWGLGVVVDLDGEPLSGDVTDHEGTEVVDPVCYQDDGHLPDAEFIAHAREDVPALLAEVTALRAELDAAHAAWGEASKVAVDGLLLVEGRRAALAERESAVDDWDWQPDAARAERTEPATGEDEEQAVANVEHILSTWWVSDGHQPPEQVARRILAALDLPGREQDPDKEVWQYLDGTGVTDDPTES